MIHSNFDTIFVNRICFFFETKFVFFFIFFFQCFLITFQCHNLLTFYFFCCHDFLSFTVLQRTLYNQCLLALAFPSFFPLRSIFWLNTFLSYMFVVVVVLFYFIFPLTLFHFFSLGSGWHYNKASSTFVYLIVLHIIHCLNSFTKRIGQMIFCASVPARKGIHATLFHTWLLSANKNHEVEST